jgi:hypothetical protein
MRLTRLWPNDGPSAVLIVTPVHAPLSEAVVKRLKQIRLRAEFHSHRAARPLELRHEGWADSAGV